MSHTSLTVPYPSFASSNAEIRVGFVSWSMWVLETAEWLFCYTIVTVKILQGNNSCSKETFYKITVQCVNWQKSLEVAQLTSQSKRKAEYIRTTRWVTISTYNCVQVRHNWHIFPGNIKWISGRTQWSCWPDLGIVVEQCFIVWRKRPAGVKHNLVPQVEGSKCWSFQYLPQHHVWEQRLLSRKRSRSNPIQINFK